MINLQAAQARQELRTLKIVSVLRRSALWARLHRLMQCQGSSVRAIRDMEVGRGKDTPLTAGSSATAEQQYAHKVAQQCSYCWGWHMTRAEGVYACCIMQLQACCSLL